jgi:peptide/nickel transport system permease protein
MKMRLISRFFKHNVSLVIGSIMLLMIIGGAIFAPYLTPHDPLEVNTRVKLEPMSRNHPLGTDPWGRDLLSRLVYGGRYSLTIGMISMGISMICGGIFGMLGGYYLESRFARLVVWITDLMMAFPTIILGVLVVMILGTGVFNTIITLAVAYFPRYTRLARGAALATKEELYIYAAKSLGMSDLRLLCTHLIPNIMSPLIVMAVIWTSSAISFEVALSFLGLGVPPPAPSWGTVLQDNLQYYSMRPLAVIAPCVAVAWAVQALNLIGDRFRDILDPRTR